MRLEQKDFSLILFPVEPKIGPKILPFGIFMPHDEKLLLFRIFWQVFLRGFLLISRSIS